MKKFAIFCDGTWQSLRNAAATNVVKLARCVAPTTADGTAQLVYYDEGVGVGSEVSPIADHLTKLIGGAFGRGLDAKIEHAYQFLVLNFEPGDEIYVFGFSRGAYTARSLCGLIRKCGILKRDCFARIPDTMDRYRNPVHPTAPEMVEFRRNYTYDLAVGEEDHVTLGIDPRSERDRSPPPATRAELYQYRARKTYRMMYAGIWDTVGEMGVPRRFDILGLDREYDFHDMKGSSLLASIRHAVAANEQREFFDLTPYDNLRDLNKTWGEHTGWNTWDDNDPKFVPYPWRPYQQRWFPGDHGSVGGGYQDSNLSNATLVWIAEGAAWAGLTFSSDSTSPLWDARSDIQASATLGTHGATTVPKGRMRADGPKSIDEISDQVWERFREKGDGYRPPNLDAYISDTRPEYIEPSGFPPAATAT